MNKNLGAELWSVGNVQHISTVVMPSAKISVSPDKHLLVDDELQINIHGLNPGQKVTLYTFLEEDGKKYESCNWFVADENGWVDLYNHPSVQGHYTGVSPMGIFWSMEPLPGQKKGIRMMKKDIDMPFNCQLYVHQGHVTSDDIRAGQTMCVGSRTIERWYKNPDVVTEVVKAGRVRGKLYLPPGDGPFQGVIDLFGTVGGLTEFRSALLASRGFASLALPYFAYEDLPQNLFDLDLEYFFEAVDWLLSHKKVWSLGAAAIGVSKGGDLALLMGAYCPKVRAVVNINGCTFNSTFPLKYQGQIIPPVELNFDRMIEVEPQIFSTKNTLQYKAEDITPIWKNNPKVLHLLGENDMCSPSECIPFMRDQYPPDKKDNCVILSYPGAGHLIEPPYTPLCSMSYHKSLKMHFVWGGEPKPHAYAQEDSWRKVLTFLRENIPTGTKVNTKTNSQSITSKL